MYYNARVNQRHRRNRRIIIIGVVLLLIGVAGFFYLRQPEKPVEKETAVALPTKKPKNIEISGTYIFSGTTYMARGIEQQAAGNINQPFSAWSSFEPDKYDAWIADLECPITDRLLTFRDQVDTLVFNCSPDFLPSLAKHFQILNLANNHTLDRGQAGLDETRRRLHQHGLQTVGDYDPSAGNETCEVIALPVRVQTEQKNDKGHLPIVFCAWNYFLDSPDPGEIEVMSKYTEHLPVIALMHSGVEYKPQAGVDQTSLARSLIDLGAEFVVGNSPHWVQNTEVYKGKLIVYSTGNFIFDQLDSETNQGLNLEVNLNVADNGSIREWLEIGESCKNAEDDCLDQAARKNLSRLKLTYKFDIFGSQGGYREVTRRASPSVQEAIKQRANWARTLNQLGQ